MRVVVVKAIHMEAIYVEALFTDPIYIASKCYELKPHTINLWYVHNSLTA